MVSRTAVTRPAFIHPLHFGRREPRPLATERAQASGFDDLRLFATTFVAGFLFVSLYLF